MDRSTGETGKMDWRDRADRLAHVVAAAPIVTAFPLLQVVRTPAAPLARLEGAVATYLWHNLSCAFPSRVFVFGKSVITEHAPDLLALPNRTPNGVILPRRDTFYSFNMIQKALADIVETLGLLPRFSAVQVPCNVRLVEGALNAEVETRNYASTKIHTDVWNGEPINSILFNIPVLGDPRGVDLRFYEPKMFPNRLRVPLDDYALGQEVAASAQEYPADFEIGNIYISDALSLHRTLKRRHTLRLSLDFRALAGTLLRGETGDCSKSRAIYVEPDEWRACGSTRILASSDVIDAYQRRRAGQPLARESLSIFNMDDFPTE